MAAAAVAYVFVAALLACSAHARRLQQGGITFNPPIINTPTPPASTASGPWANFTREPQALYISLVVLNSTTTDTDEACAVLCNEDPKCEFFSWCPTNVTSGCGIPAANATYSSTVAPGGCVTSWDPAQNRSAVFLAGGKSVPFVAGMYSPQNGGGARRLLQGGIGSSGSSVWSNFTNLENRFYQAIDALATISAKSADECAGACNADERCYFWTLCPLSQSAGCEVPSFTPNASPQTVPAGTCLLSYDGTKDQTALFRMSGADVTFVGGYYNASTGTTTPSTPGTSPSPGVSPSVTLPTIPGLTPPTSGGGNTTLPANATGGPLVIRAFWATTPKEGVCYKFNGTGFEADNSTTYVSSGNQKVGETAYNSYLSSLCGSPDTAGEKIGKDLLKGGEDARMAWVATLDKCPDATEDLSNAFIVYVNPRGNQDVQRVIDYATAWRTAADQLGDAACVTIAVIDTASGKVTVTTISPAQTA